MFRDRKSSDARDKVYALLELTSPSPWMASILPDYSLSEVEVFCQATVQCIYETQSLSIFSTDLGRKFRDDLPSWVPDWSAPGGPTYEARKAAVELYNACPSGGLANATVVNRGEGVSLRVEGLKIGTIDRVGDVMWGGEHRDMWRATLANWWKVWHLNDDDACRKSMFLRMVCGDVLGDNSNNQIRRTRPADELSFVVWVLHCSYSAVLLEIDEVWTETALAWRNLAALWPRRSVLTQSISQEDALHDLLIGFDLNSGSFRSTMLVHERLENLIIFAEDDALSFKDFFSPGLQDQQNRSPQIRLNAPWSQLFDRVKQRLVNNYGADANLDLDHHRSRSRVIEENIMAATLLRRLIMGGPHVGLGPAKAQVGDELFFLKGGRTPFVLRAMAGRSSMAGLMYEIVGDCYLHDLMDAGENKVEEGGGWQDIFLV